MFNIVFLFICLFESIEKEIRVEINLGCDDKKIRLMCIKLYNFNN